MSNLPSKPAFPPTAEQQAIISAGKERTESLLVNAYAGTGKTTTMVMLANALPPEKPVMALAFNRTIADTLIKVLPPHFTVKTFNGLGHSAWGKATGKRLILDDRKIGRLVTLYFKSLGAQYEREDWANVKDLVNLAYKNGLTPREITHVKGLIPDTEDSWESFADELGIDIGKYLNASRSILFSSVKESIAGTISFDDQVYMSVLFGGIFPKFSDIIIDEAQDLSPLNHLQIQKSSTGRLFVVGDRFQAIYAFRGADHNSITKLKALKKDWIELPLFTTFRCPKVIVERASAHAPGYTAFEKNPIGQILVLPKPQLGVKDPENPPKWKWNEITTLGYSEIAVLCRNNAPLMSMAFKLLRRGIGCKMLGREIGKGLINLAKKIIPVPQTDLSTCIELIQHWKSLEVAKASALNQENKIDGIHDRAESLLAVAEHAMPKNAGELFTALENLFSRDSGQITLSSGHKSKGLEWDVVIHLDPFRIPSKWAKSPSEIQQENNLRYVIETRPKKVLVLADLKSFE